jgi:uncharacterized protein DUF4232
MSVMEQWMRVPFWSGVATVLAGSVAGAMMMLAPSGNAASGTRTATPECTNAEVTATYKGGDAAMSHVYGRIILRNTSETTCWVRGYGGLSYVGGGDGKQVGAAADRTPSNKPKVVLAPGDKVRSAVVETSTGPYSKKQCQPTPVDGFRVYIPDETRSQFIEHPTTGCANDEIHLLTHKAYH